MDNPIDKLNSDIQKIVTNFAREHQYSLIEVKEQNIILANQVRELKQKLNSSEILNGKLKKQLDAYSIDTNLCVCQKNKKSKFSQNIVGKHLFRNFENSENVMKENILVPDTCAFGNDDVRRFNARVDGVKLLNRALKCDSSLSTIYQSNSSTNIEEFCDLKSTKGYSQSTSQNELSFNNEDEVEKILGKPDDDNDFIGDKTQLIDDDDDVDDPDETRLEIEFSDENSADDMDENESTREIQFKYEGPAVRKKAERRALPGFACFECQEYYKAVGETDSQIEHRIQQCSKHRARFSRPATPEGFWDIAIPKIESPTIVEKITLKGRRTRLMEIPNREWKR